MANITKANLLADIRSCLNEPVANVFSDTELYNWLDEAAQEYSKLTLGKENSSTFQLSTSTGSYTYATAGCTNAHSIDTILYMGQYAVGEEGVTEPLAKVHPRMRGNIGEATTGQPREWYEMDRTIYVYPTPASGQNGKYLKVLFYDYATEYFTTAGSVYNLQEHAQEFLIFYVLAKAFEKDGKYGQAVANESIFRSFCGFLREDRIRKLPDSTDMLKQPDFTQVSR